MNFLSCFILIARQLLLVKFVPPVDFVGHIYNVIMFNFRLLHSFGI